MRGIRSKERIMVLVRIHKPKVITKHWCFSLFTLLSLWSKLWAIRGCQNFWLPMIFLYKRKKHHFLCPLFILQNCPWKMIFRNITTMNFPITVSHKYFEKATWSILNALKSYFMKWVRLADLKAYFEKGTPIFFTTIDVNIYDALYTFPKVFPLWYFLNIQDSIYNVDYSQHLEITKMRKIFTDLNI